MTGLFQKMVEAFPGLFGWMQRITLLQVVVLGLLAMQGYDYVKAGWGATSWFVKPALAGAIKDVLKEDGIDLKALVEQGQQIQQSAEDTGKKVDNLTQQLETLLELQGQVVQDLKNQQVPPVNPQ